MPEANHIPTNAARKERAHRLILIYSRDVGEPVYSEECLTDLLADVMHWLEDTGLDLDECLRRARMHYEAEVSDHD